MEPFFDIAPLVLIFPLIGVLFNGLVGQRFVDDDRNTGEKWSGWFGSIMALSSFVVVLLLDLALQASHHEAHFTRLWDWIIIPGQEFSVAWAMQIDTLSVAMMLVVTGVGSIIHIYTIGYMHGDKDYARYFAYMNLFLFFMLILVSADNYLVLFVGWEGVGLCSYLLIGFWHERLTKDGVMKNANAARKAMVVNRIGDAAMILAIILTFWAFGSLVFNDVFHQAVEMFAEGQAVQAFGIEISLGTVLTAITVLFLIAATGKSAQLILHVWLPDAMAGPTPASALIHAATMVTSGIYLIVRSNVLYELARAISLASGQFSSSDLVALVGASTAMYAGLIAFTRYDIKKVLAYSTVSQLGFMIAAAGMGAYVAAIFHLVTHAFFKALLFMGAGSVIHGMEHGHHEISPGGDHDHEDDEFDPQDMRYMGGLRHKMKWTFWAYLIGALALSGIWPFAGFWSKDEILAHANFSGNTEYPVFKIVYIMLALAAMFTAFYMGRQLRMVFWGDPRHEAAEHAHESPRVMTVPLVILAFFGIVAGLFNFPLIGGNDVLPFEAGLTLEHWLEETIVAFELVEEGVLSEGQLPTTPTSIQWPVAIISLGLALVSLGAAFHIYRNKPKTVSDPDPTQKIPGLWGFFGKLPLDTLYMHYFVPWFNRFAWWLSQKFEWRFWHDFFHDNLIRDTFLWFADLCGNILDAQGIDGLVNGLGSATKWLADRIRTSQSGYARTYALSVFLGAVALLIYFLWPYIMGQ